MNYKLHTPEGVRDLLPEECAKKKEIEKRIECVLIDTAIIMLKPHV